MIFRYETASASASSIGYLGMSGVSLKPCQDKVELLNDYYRAIVRLSELTDELAALSDTDTPEFQTALGSVKGAREAVDTKNTAIKLHVAQCVACSSKLNSSG